MWVSEIIGTEVGDECGGDEYRLILGNSVVSTQGWFGGDLPGSDPVSDRLWGHSEPLCGFGGGEVFGVHVPEVTQKRKIGKRTPGSRGGRAPGVL